MSYSERKPHLQEYYRQLLSKIYSNPEDISNKINQIMDITYLSASIPIEITFDGSTIRVYKDRKRRNRAPELSIELIVLKEMCKELPDKLKNAMNNYLTYMSTSPVVFHSNDTSEFLVDIYDSHIFGLINYNTILSKVYNEDMPPGQTTNSYTNNVRLYANPESVSIPNIKDIRNLEKINLPSLPSFIRSLSFYGNINEYCSQLSNAIEEIQNLPSSKRDYYRQTKSLPENSDKTREELENEYYTKMINSLNEAQSALSSIYKNRSLQFQLKLLTYSMIKDGKRINRITLEDIKETIEKNEFRFSQSFKKYCSKNINILPIKILSEINIDETIEQMKLLETIQDFLQYKYIEATKMIFSSERCQRTRSLLEHDIGEGNSKVNRKLGVHGLSNILISSSINELNSKLDTLSPSYFDEISIYKGMNIFKILDKITYLNHFNYDISTRRIFLTDLQYSDEFNCICEMDIDDELLMAYVEPTNKYGRFTFYSMQNANELTIINKSISLPYKTNMPQNDAPVLVGLAEIKDATKGVSNIITQTHSDIRQKVIEETMSPLELKANILSGKIVLRYAVALDVTSDNKKIAFNDFFHNLSHSKKHTTILQEESIDLNIVGTLKVYKWLEQLNATDVDPEKSFEHFCGIQFSSTDFYEIKSVLMKSIKNQMTRFYKEKLIYLQNRIAILRENSNKQYNLTQIFSTDDAKYAIFDKLMLEGDSRRISAIDEEIEKVKSEMRKYN